MSRKHRHPFEKLPDPKYQEILITKFVNCLMVGGKGHCRNDFYGPLNS